MFSRLKAFAGGLLAMAVDYVDPVPQNVNAVVMGKYKGILVRLVPVLSADGHVESWIPDPQETPRIDAVLAANTGNNPQQSVPPAPPAPPLPPLP